MKWIFIAFFITASSALIAQQNVHHFEVWPAYISSVPIDQKYSLWNDFHWIPNTFVLVRHGLTRHFTNKMSMTAGYAWVRTSTPWSDRLARQEYRPWAQWEAGLPLSSAINYRFRLRYDARFRKRLSGLRIEEDFLFQNRIRFMNSLRFKVKDLGEGKVLHFNIMNETLFQFGQGIDGFRLDQNRSYLLWGLGVSHFTFLAGYHLRVIPGKTQTNFNHGLTFWVVQRFGA